MEEYLQVMTTCDQRCDADTIAQALVDGELAACVQIAGPIVSIYRWKGNVEKAQEWICSIKTTRSLYAEVEAAIQAVHPYETPEIIAVPITAGSEKYLKWLDDSVKTVS